MIDELAKKLFELQTNDPVRVAELIRSELAKAAGGELLAVSNGNFRCSDQCKLYYDIDLLVIQLASARERIKELEAKNDGMWKSISEYMSRQP